MKIAKSELFIGAPISSELRQSLNKLDSQLTAMFIADDVDHLNLYEHEGQLLLGKRIGEMSDAAGILLVGTHIISVIKKLLPEYPADIQSLVIFPTQSNS